MIQHTPVIEIVMQDVSDTGPDFVTGIYIAAFTVAEVAAAFGNTEAADALKITPGAGGWRSRDDLRPMVAECYGPEFDPSTHEARDMFRPEFADLFMAVDEGTVSPEDLVFAARVIERYLRIAVTHHGDI